MVLKAIPETILSDKSMEFLLINCPCFTHDFYIYAFTVPLGMCYSMVFQFEGNCYMISIISKQIIPYLFSSFLSDTHRDFVQAEEPIIPENQLDYIYAILKSWDLQVKIANPFNKAKIITYWNQEPSSFTLISSTHKYVIDTNYLSFQHYNPFHHFTDENKIIRAWHSVFCSQASSNFNPETNILSDDGSVSDSHSSSAGKSQASNMSNDKNYPSVLVVAKSKQHLYSCVFAVAALIFPFHFKGNVLITTSPFDMRLKHCEGYDIIGVTDEILQFIPHFEDNFSVVLKENFNNYGNPVCESAIKEKNMTTGKALLYFMDLALNSNPFNDFFENDYLPKNLDQMLDSMNPVPKEDRIMTPYSIQASELREIADSKTMKQWRKKAYFRSSFRNAFLASHPKDVIPTFSQEQLAKLPSILKELKEKYKNDLHMSSVIKRYKKYLEQPSTE